MICIFSTNFFYIPSADALSDSKQFVLDAWTLVNEGYYDPERLDELPHPKIRVPKTRASTNSATTA